MIDLDIIALVNILIFTKKWQYYQKYEVRESSVRNEWVLCLNDIKQIYRTDNLISQYVGILG